MTRVPSWGRRVLSAVLPSIFHTRLKGGFAPARVAYGNRLGVAARGLLAPRRRVLTKMPLPWWVLTKIAAVNGYWLEVNPNHPHDIAVNGESGRPMASSAGAPVINGVLLSNGKSTVADVFEDVFGYSLAVDPTEHVGPMVEKSEINALHDGRVLIGPIQPDEVDPAKSYQRFVDTRDEEGLVVDLRTPLYGGVPPLVYSKRRGAEDLFWTRTAAAEIHEATDVYSPSELSSLARFADAMGLDYGEVDVLRDRTDGRIYVVDVNQGPAGPPKGLSQTDKELAIRRLAAAFDAFVEEVLRGGRLAAGSSTR